MTPETLTALKASIAKWRRNAVAETPEAYLVAPEDCALCDMFYAGDCEGCPVMAATGRRFCVSTPHGSAQVVFYRWLAGHTDGTAARAAAIVEVAFLESLLPAECPTCADAMTITCPTCDGASSDADADECPTCGHDGEVDCPACGGADAANGGAA